MAVWAVSMIRDEADIAAATVGHMAGQVDHVLVADNMSRDGTRDLLNALPGVTVVDDLDPAYRQSQKMTALAHTAQAAGAEWVVPFDADEVWRATAGGTIRDTLTGCDADIAAADLYDHVVTGCDDPTVTDPTRRIRWRRPHPGPLPKVACRTADDLTIDFGNHNATYTSRVPVRVSGLLTVHHYPYRSAAQFIRKAVQGAQALAAAGVPRSIGAHWQDYARIHANGGDAALTDVYRTWFTVDDPAAAGLVADW